MNKGTGSTVQRIARTEKNASPEYQAWHRHIAEVRSVHLYEYPAGWRPSPTKEDIDRVRHVYLDFDDNGTAAVQALLKREGGGSRNKVL